MNNLPARRESDVPLLIEYQRTFRLVLKVGLGAALYVLWRRAATRQRGTGPNQAFSENLGRVSAEGREEVYAAAGASDLQGVAAALHEEAERVIPLCLELLRAPGAASEGERYAWVVANVSPPPARLMEAACRTCPRPQASTWQWDPNYAVWPPYASSSPVDRKAMANTLYFRVYGTFPPRMLAVANAQVQAQENVAALKPRTGLRGVLDELTGR